MMMAMAMVMMMRRRWERLQNATKFLSLSLSPYFPTFKSENFFHHTHKIFTVNMKSSLRLCDNNTRILCIKTPSRPNKFFFHSMFNNLQIFRPWKKEERKNKKIYRNTSFFLKQYCIITFKLQKSRKAFHFSLISLENWVKFFHFFISRKLAFRRKNFHSVFIATFAAFFAINSLKFQHFHMPEAFN